MVVVRELNEIIKAINFSLKITNYCYIIQEIN